MYVRPGNRSHVRRHCVNHIKPILKKTKRCQLLDLPTRARPFPLVRLAGLFGFDGLDFPIFISSCGLGGMRSMRSAMRRVVSSSADFFAMMTDRYGETFLAGIGLIAVEWAKLEHELKIHTSAMAARKTQGNPLDHLDVGFKTLRRMWRAELKRHLPGDFARAERLDTKLADLAIERDIAVHSQWSATDKRGTYKAWMLKQPEKKGIDIREGRATPRLLRSVANRIADAHAELRTITRGKHGGQYKRARLI